MGEHKSKRVYLRPVCAASHRSIRQHFHQTTMNPHYPCGTRSALACACDLFMERIEHAMALALNQNMWYKVRLIASELCNSITRLAKRYIAYCRCYYNFVSFVLMTKSNCFHNNWLIFFIYDHLFKVYIFHSISMSYYRLECMYNSILFDIINMFYKKNNNLVV